MRQAVMIDTAARRVAKVAMPRLVSIYFTSCVRSVNNTRVVVGSSLVTIFRGVRARTS
jgi:hypothetical protein